MIEKYIEKHVFIKFQVLIIFIEKLVFIKYVFNIANYYLYFQTLKQNTEVREDIDDDRKPHKREISTQTADGVRSSSVSGASLKQNKNVRS